MYTVYVLSMYMVLNKSQNMWNQTIMRKFPFILVYLPANAQPPSLAFFHYQKLFRRLILPRISIIEIVESEFSFVSRWTVRLAWLTWRFTVGCCQQRAFANVWKAFTSPFSQVPRMGDVTEGNSILRIRCGAHCWARLTSKFLMCCERILKRIFDPW